MLAGEDKAPGALWLSGNNGKPMRYDSVAAAIGATTLLTVGMSVSPHMFRTSGASSAAIHAGYLPYLGSGILHHTGPQVTDEHYVRTSSMSAAKIYMDIIDSYLLKRARNDHVTMAEGSLLGV